MMELARAASSLGPARQPLPGRAADDCHRVLLYASRSASCRKQVVPVVGGSSAHCDPRRARDGSREESSAAASKTPAVSAAACVSYASDSRRLSAGGQGDGFSGVRAPLCTCRTSTWSLQRAARDACYRVRHGRTMCARDLDALCGRSRSSVSRCVCRVARTRALCAKVSMQCLPYIM